MVLQIVGNKLRVINKNLFPIKAKTLMQLDFKRNAKRKKPLLRFWVAASRPPWVVFCFGYHMFEKKDTLEWIQRKATELIKGLEIRQTCAQWARSGWRRENWKRDMLIAYKHLERCYGERKDKIMWIIRKRVGSHQLRIFMEIAWNNFFILLSR